MYEKNDQGRILFGGETIRAYHFLDYNTTGDGLLTAIQLIGVMKKKGRNYLN